MHAKFLTEPLHNTEQISYPRWCSRNQGEEEPLLKPPA